MAKTNFDGTADALITSLPNLGEKLSLTSEPSLACNGKKIRFSLDAMSSILDPVVLSICDRVKEQYDKKNFCRLYPVGGLTRLTYYMKKLEERFRGKGKGTPKGQPQ